MHEDAPGPRLVLVALAAAVGFTVLFAAGVAGGFTHGRWQDFFNHWVYTGGIAVAFGCVAWRAVAVRAERGAWLAIAAGLGCFLLGDLYFNGFLAALEEPPYPSWADAGWLLFYPFAYVGLVLLIRGRVERLPASSWLEGVIGALALASVAAAVAFDPLVASTEGVFSTIATNLAYPTGDVLLLTFVCAGAALQGWRSGRAWAFLAVGLASMALADSIYLVQTAQGTYREGGWVDAAWPTAAVLIAIGAWQPEATRRPRVALEGWMPQAMTVAFSMLALGVLVLESVRQVNLVAHLLVIATMVAIMGRLGLAGRERRALESSREEARTDELTGLGNRRDFYRRADERLVAAAKQGDAVALLSLDLTRFKEFNDTLGHHAGDQLLREVGRRLAACLPGGAVARLGGDEFVALSPPGVDERQARDIALEIQAALGTPLELEGMVTYAHGSIGIALFPDHATTRGDLLRHADVAMYRAKQQGTGIEIYAPHGDHNSRDRLELAGDLHGALAAGNQLVLYYQPKADLATGDVTGVEALVRWQHPTRGLLHPDSFLPIAQQHGLMHTFTRAVLDHALRQQRAWQRAGLELQVAVNLDAANLLDLRFPDEVGALLDRYETPPGALQLEITENTVMVDPVRILDILAGLGELGINLALDDFGTGYSSLAYLKRLPVQELKIDKSFVQDMLIAHEDATIVRSIVDLGRNLGLRVVAEGAETPDHWTALAGLGCHTAQGYYLTRPLPAPQLATWLGGYRRTNHHRARPVDERDSRRT